MDALRARVKDGRLILDEPTTLPEGMTLDLVLDDEGDDLDDAERKALNEAIARAWRSAAAGAVKSGAEVIDELRRRR